ncbi:unnamed protein product [Miscanthus lutarioriparius]|uniref:Uncharacterized protein n=1 Tax=Miscanthus lutarioriparius TaxID=422564 RepID=A0A811N9T3_9POAL|nr:unnamed protein product [Miscanthus lutarioriparius]
MATDVLRAHNILMPVPQRIRAAAAAHRRSAGSGNHHPGASTRRSPPAGTSSPAAGRRHHGRKARPTAEVYAGPAFSTSPDPSSLPLPQFSARKAVAVAAVDAAAAATRDLRLILRLE